MGDRKAKAAAREKHTKVVHRPALKAEAADVVEGHTSGALKMAVHVVNDIAVPPAPNAAKEAKAKAWNKKHIKKSAKKEVKKAAKKSNVAKKKAKKSKKSKALP